MVIILSTLLTLICLPLIFVVSVVGGIIKYKRTPKPPPGLNKRELEDYYSGGWKDYERIKELDKQIKEIEEQEFALRIESNVEKIGQWEQQIEKIELLLDAVEIELATETDSQKRIGLMEKQLSLSEKRFDLQSKINDMLRFGE